MATPTKSLQPLAAQSAEPSQQAVRTQQQQQALQTTQAPSNNIYIYKSSRYQYLPGLGNFYPAFFTQNKTDLQLIQQRFTLSTLRTVFCFVLNDSNTLNLDWKLSRQFNFPIVYKIDYEKLQKWFTGQKRMGRTISAFFTR